MNGKIIPGECLHSDYAFYHSTGFDEYNGFFLERIFKCRFSRNPSYPPPFSRGPENRIDLTLGGVSATFGA